MKKIVFLALMFVFLVISAQATAAFLDTIPQAKKPLRQIVAKNTKPVFKANKKNIDNARKTLALKDWLVSLSALEDNKSMGSMDILAFSKDKFNSKTLSYKGFSASDFTVTVADNGTVDWETVQTAKNGDMAVWKGQLQAELMRGILSLYTTEGKIEDFYFTNKNGP